MDEDKKTSGPTVLSKLTGSIFGFGAEQRIAAPVSHAEGERLPEELEDLTRLTAVLGEDCLEPGASIVDLWNAWFGRIKEPEES